MSVASAPRKPRRRRDRYYPINHQLVRDRRMALRLSTNILADLLGVSEGAIDHLEHGGEQNHLTIAFVSDLARVLGLSVPELLAPPHPTPGDEGDLVDPEDPATVGRVLAEVGTVHVDHLAAGLGWSIGRTLHALSVLADRLPAVGQQLSWLADSQVALIHAHGDPAPVAPITRRTATVWGLTADDAALLGWVARKGSHRAVGQEVNPVVVSKLRAAGLIDSRAVHGPRSSKAADEQLRLTDDTRYNLCLDEHLVAARRSGDGDSPSPDPGTAGGEPPR